MVLIQDLKTDEPVPHRRHGLICQDACSSSFSLFDSEQSAVAVVVLELGPNSGLLPPDAIEFNYSRTNPDGTTKQYVVKGMKNTGWNEEMQDYSDFIKEHFS